MKISARHAHRSRRSLLIAALMVAASCLGDRSTPTAPQTQTTGSVPAHLISDGAHSNGTAGFFFLPPVVSSVNATGPFDDDVAFANPVVAICDVTAGPDVACGASTPGATAAIRSFTLTSSPPITIDGEKYKVNWDTGEEGFVAGRLYRLHVFAGPARHELGFADVLLTTKPGQVKNYDDQIIVLNDGRTLPIHFRIEEGAVPRIGPAKSFELTGLPSSLESGSIASVTVTARDENGNVASGYRGTVVFTSSDAGATLPSPYTFTEGDAGTHTFANAISLLEAGAATVRATDDADANIFGEASTTVLPLAAATLEVTGLIDPSEAGAVNSILVTARDVNGNVATGYAGTIAFTATDQQATLPASYTFTAEDAGTHAFPASATLRTAGSVTVTATDDAVNTITGAQTVTITAAAASTLAPSGVPAQSTAGVAYDLTVTAKDQFGNTATSYAGTVKFSSSDAAATVPADYTFQAGDAGVRSFTGGVAFRTAGPHTLQVVDAAATSIAGSVTTTVGPAAASQLRFTAQPSDVLAGSAIAPAVVVTAYDAFDNLASTFTGPISVVIGTNPTGAVLSGTPQLPAVAGLASFSELTINAAGTGYTLVAASSGLTSATSEPFDVIAPVPIEVHWTNASGGNWSVASNWSTRTVPTAEQTALIDLPGTYTVTLDVNATVNSLTLGATTGVQSINTANSRTLTVMTSANVLGTGRLTLNTSTITGPATLAIASGGVLNLSGSSAVNAPLVNAGTVVTFNASALNGSVTTVAGSLIRVVSVGFGGANLTVASGFTNHGTIELTGTATNGTSFTVNGTLVNDADGTISILAGVGGARTLRAELDNRGTLSLGASLTISRAGAHHMNSGLVVLDGGNLTVSEGGSSSSFTNTGRVTVPAGRVWSINGGSFTQATGATLDGGGALSLSSVNPAAFETAFTLSALSLVGGGTVASFATDITTETLALTIAGATVNGPGTLTNAAGKTLTLSSTTTINTALANAGTLVVLNSSVLNGPFTTVAGSLLRLQSVGFGGASLVVASSFTNNGAIELTGTTTNGAALTVNGTLLNATDATIAILAGVGGGRTIRASIDNQGTFTVATSLLLNLPGANFLNRGLLDLTGGNMTFEQRVSFTNTGTVTVPVGRTFAVSASGSTFTHASGATLDGGGALSLTSSVTAVFETAFSLGALTLGSGTVATFATDLTTETLTLTISGATVNAGTLTNAAGRTLTLSSTTTINAALVNAGTLVVQNSSTLNGAFTTAAGSLLRVQGVSFGGSTLTVASGFTNNGTIELTSTISAGAILNVNGTLVNAANATVSALAGAGGGRLLNVQLDNQGTLSVAAPLTINRASTDHTNSGTMTVTGGDLTITQSLTTPSFTNSGTIDVATGRALRISVGAVTNGAGGSIQGAGTFETGGFGGSLPFNNAGGVTVALARIGSGLTSTGTFAPVTAQFFGATTIPVGPGYSYTNVNLQTNASFAGSVSMSGNLTVASGNLTIGAHEIIVGGNFATQSTGVLTMLNAGSTLTVGGNATFAGGSTNTRLTLGTLRVGGNFAQTGSAAAFAASGTHLTVLNGSGAQAVSFANPGTATTLSHFQRLEIENASAPGVTIGSAVFANGQLRTASSAAARTIRSSSGQTLQAGGLDAVGLVMDGTPLRVANGEALTRFDDAVFRNMNPAATQFRLERLDGTVTFNNILFETTPTTGAYMHLVDTNLAAPIFTVTMQGTQPPNHGGKIIESMGGQLIGWPF